MIRDNSLSSRWGEVSRRGEYSQPTKQSNEIVADQGETVAAGTDPTEERLVERRKNVQTETASCGTQRAHDVRCRFPDLGTRKVMELDDGDHGIVCLCEWDGKQWVVIDDNYAPGSCD